MEQPVKKKGLTENLAGADLFIYADDGQELMILNRSALFIWSLCDGRHGPGEMEGALAEIYPDTAGETLRADIAACLDSFRDKGLLEEG
jgi:hypothetical protein